MKVKNRGIVRVSGMGAIAPTFVEDDHFAPTFLSKIFSAGKKKEDMRIFFMIVILEKRVILCRITFF